MAIVLAPQYTQKVYRWIDWKNILTKKSFVYQYDDDGIIYTIYGYDGPEVHLCQIWKNVVPDSVAVNYSQEQNDLDKNDFEINFKSIGNLPIEQRTSDGRIRLVAEKTNVSTVTFYSHNWADKTTWYEKSIRITENAINSGDNLTYNLSHINIIDSYHGKYTNEDYIIDSNGHSYRVAVTVDGYVKTEQDPHFGTGGNFIVNYSSGHITFLSALDSASIVSVTYHYASSSVFTIKPAPGKQLRFGVVEVQFSDDIQITDSTLFQPYGYVEVFAPQYCTINGGPYPPGTKIPLGNPIIYKTIQDYLNDSKKSYPVYPALGGSGWRGMQNPSIIMDWDYEGDKVLRYDYGMEIRVFLQHDIPFGGNYGTATFYCKSELL